MLLVMVGCLLLYLAVCISAVLSCQRPLRHVGLSFPEAGYGADKFLYHHCRFVCCYAISDESYELLSRIEIAVRGGGESGICTFLHSLRDVARFVQEMLFFIPELF